MTVGTHELRTCKNIGDDNHGGNRTNAPSAESIERRREADGELFRGLLKAFFSPGHSPQSA